MSLIPRIVLFVLLSAPLLSVAQPEANEIEEEMPKGHESLSRQLAALTAGDGYTLIHAQLEQPGAFGGTPKKIRQEMTLLYGNGELYAFSTYRDIPTRMDELLGVSIFPSDLPDPDGFQHASALKKEAIHAADGAMQQASETALYNIKDNRIVSTKDGSSFKKTGSDLVFILDYMYLLTTLCEWPLLKQNGELVTMKGQTELKGVNFCEAQLTSDITFETNGGMRVSVFPGLPERDMFITLAPEDDGTLATIRFSSGPNFSKIFHIRPREKLATDDPRAQAFIDQVNAELAVAELASQIPTPCPKRN
ncbi:hypothetical protein H5P28_18880 [Ruficoccus amylovorans]|uniref:DUF4412 domain-containing protein n=1 Tax=Ruficoccus amylovorans TaxID=1804625 RepID=A0A842HLJ4_9BACT|nr:hypothetical protein [Ruficoccus amylovorans]MBC2596337.1 hypothetical protein [Ruficoccus amylovorans]